MPDFLVPAGAGSGEYDEKRSRFLAEIRPVSTPAEAEAFITSVKKTHHDARHNVYAYVLRSGETRYSDDGEPQGTAGQPILNVLTGAGLTDVCCTVTRYFGGILLGTGGLTRAYAAAAKAALEDAGIAKLEQYARYRFSCPYPLYERVRYLMQTQNAVQETADYGAEIEMSVLLPANGAQPFLDALTALSGGAVCPEKDGEALLRGEISPADR